ncbi:Hsp20/alpha crystallin family protein [Flagellimonas sp. CMM7]|uniref:Hsp20/alpha crystallin family protein n=1 Tax=Flagellimonas sp. CMM7 TaxID=2654676 RepID=UPI0013D549FD|nr:Hsp20/alpha crystallin family protein [Flagellimonas sp. CMM7]UII78879.1 Hsp20/alpha crystallin family protein [Flagellimonas sp. CMM7]
MSIVKRNSLFFPSLMNDLARPDWFGGMENLNTNLPAVNIKNNTENFELELSVPGGNKDDFKVEVDNDVLTISTEVKTEDKEIKENYSRKEFSFSSFKRAFTLPETVDGTKIDAAYENGILRLTLPKKEEALPRPKRLITIG